MSPALETTASATAQGERSPDYYACCRLRRALFKIRKCVELYAAEFCDELHKDYPSLIKCWHWAREIHHLIEVGVDPEDNWSDTATSLLLDILNADAEFLAGVRKSLQGGTGELLLECGASAGYDGPWSRLAGEECDQRLKSAGVTATHFLSQVDNFLDTLDDQLEMYSNQRTEMRRINKPV